MSMIHSNIKLSFIAPLYKVAPYINRFLRSYLSQTRIEDTELIIVDDASPDNSVEIIGAILKKNPMYQQRISIIHHAHNMGLASTRQTGLEAAQGEYVIFVDSDDYFDPNLAERMLAKANETKADIVCSDLYYEYQYGKRYVTCKYNTSPQKIIMRILNNTIGSAGQYTRIVKRSLFNKAEISFLPGINMFEDRLLAIKLFSNATRIAYIHEAFYHYVQYNYNSVTKKLSENTVKEMLRAEAEIRLCLLPRDERYKKYIQDFRCYIKFFLWLSQKASALELAKELYQDANRRILFSKSIPKQHTRIMLYMYVSGHERTSQRIKKIIRNMKRMAKEKDVAPFSPPHQFSYDVSVIIVNYNTKELLRNCLHSLYNQTKGISFEVFVSDNGSRDGSLAMLRTDFPQVKVVDNNANLGFGAANNRALALATGKYIFYLNSDTVVLNNAIKIFFDYWEQNDTERNLGAIGGNLLDEKNKIIHSAGVFRSIDTEISEALYDMVRSYKLIIPGLKKRKMGKEPPATEKIIGAVDYVTGADLFVRNDENAYFDERYFLYYEETDMQKRMEKLGKERRIIEGPLIQHLKGGSNSATIPLNFYKSVSKINTFLSCCKFQRKFHKNPVRLFMLKLIITIHWLNPGLIRKTGKHIGELWRT